MSDPISDERLAEIRAGLEGDHFDLLCVVQWLEAGCDPGKAAEELRRYIPKHASLLSRLDKAEGRDRTQATFEVHQDGAPVAMASGPRERAYAEAMHYAAVYGQDSPVEVFEMVPVALLLPPSES